MHRKFAAATGRRQNKQRGFVLVTMAVAAIALIGVLGLAVDLGHLFISKNETQAYCDSAALAAALVLDGTTGGITNAKAAVTSSTNAWNFSTASVSSPTVTFATALAGPWQSNPSPAAGYTFVKVSATVPMKLYFIPVLVAQTVANVNSSATAAQVDLTTIPIGLAPYTAVSTDTTGPNFWAGDRKFVRHSLAAIQFSSQRLRSHDSRRLFQFATVYRRYRHVQDGSGLKLGV